MGKKRKLQFKDFHIDHSNFKNRYFLTTMAFLAWMIFMDKNGFSTNISLRKTIANLEASKLDYEEKIAAATRKKLDMEQNKEKYAREKYLMHKENEELIIIEK